MFVLGLLQLQKMDCNYIGGVGDKCEHESEKVLHKYSGGDISCFRQDGVQCAPSLGGAAPGEVDNLSSGEVPKWS